MNETWFSWLNRFFFGNKSNSSNDLTLPDSFPDPEAFVVEKIVPGRCGQISYGGSFWMARCTQPISLLPGTLVRVKGRNNLTLLVEPIHHLLPNISSKKCS